MFDMFNEFNETIFLKTDSNLEKEIEKLKKVRNDSNKDKIDKEIKLLELGLQGEKQIEFELKNANIGMYVLHDVTFEYQDQKAQVDYIIITKGFIYFVECKNLIGNITINDQGEFRREYTLGNKTYKEAIYSPYSQAMRHKNLYQKLWKSENTSFLDKTLRRNSIEFFYKPLVVLANSKGLLNIKYAPKEIKENTIRVDNLINFIKNDIKNLDKDYYWNKKDMKYLAEDWLEMNIQGSTYISDKYKSNEEEKGKVNDLKSKLESFRKEKSKSMNVPAYYVFTNDELEKILETKPQNIEELKNVLPAIKVKVHGEDIVKIINE